MWSFLKPPLNRGDHLTWIINWIYEYKFGLKFKDYNGSWTNRIFEGFLKFFITGFEGLRAEDITLVKFVKAQ